MQFRLLHVLQVKQRIETEGVDTGGGSGPKDSGATGTTQKMVRMNCYYINYKASEKWIEMDDDLLSRIPSNPYE